MSLLPIAPPFIQEILEGDDGLFLPLWIVRTGEDRLSGSMGHHDSSARPGILTLPPATRRSSALSTRSADFPPAPFSPCTGNVPYVNCFDHLTPPLRRVPHQVCAAAVPLPAVSSTYRHNALSCSEDRHDVPSQQFSPCQEREFHRHQ